MKRSLRVLFIIAVLTISFGAVGSAVSSGKDIRQLMGSNFAHLQKILVELIRSDFKEVPKDVEVIEHHASELIKTPPLKIGADKEVFLALADSLLLHAKSLRLIAGLVVEHDKKQVTPGMLNVDYLRNTAAAHYGQMVTSCVACHNLFRRHIP